VRRALFVVPGAALLAMALVALRPWGDPAQGSDDAAASTSVPARAILPGTTVSRPAASPEALPTLYLASSPQRAVSLGESIDLATTGPSAIPASVALNIAFDPRVLRLRTTEEIDYADASIDRGSVEQVQVGEGVLRVSGGARPPGAGAPARRLGLAQFETIGAGATTIRVSVAAVEEGGAITRLPFAAPVCECQVNVY
jgi:hypothetical protein